MCRENEPFSSHDGAGPGKSYLLFYESEPGNPSSRAGVSGWPLPVDSCSRGKSENANEQTSIESCGSSAVEATEGDQETERWKAFLAEAQTERNQTDFKCTLDALLACSEKRRAECKRDLDQALRAIRTATAYAEIDLSMCHTLRMSLRSVFNEYIEASDSASTPAMAGAERVDVRPPGERTPVPARSDGGVREPPLQKGQPCPSTGND